MSKPKSDLIRSLLPKGISVDTIKIKLSVVSDYSDLNCALTVQICEENGAYAELSVVGDGCFPVNPDELAGLAEYIKRMCDEVTPCCKCEDEQ